ncbi:hypothetical protein GALMADRAFT_1352538 [Galerina marginata CBS 339.88]|uniref:Uncharacterized protein n=1 Tax=Galerina marginata (strain CBS 339.88) TaxID=685588 RepID=A0A067SRY6_GALM3|nr:hypothetical protein GALMADRAFT_1352538 [Galerina marginata CBS 339.88]
MPKSNVIRNTFGSKLGGLIPEAQAVIGAATPNPAVIESGICPPWHEHFQCHRYPVRGANRNREYEQKPPAGRPQPPRGPSGSTSALAAEGEGKGAASRLGSSESGLGLESGAVLPDRATADSQSQNQTRSATGVNVGATPTTNASSSTGSTPAVAKHPFPSPRWSSSLHLSSPTKTKEVDSSSSARVIYDQIVVLLSDVLKGQDGRPGPGIRSVSVRVDVTFFVFRFRVAF